MQAKACQAKKEQFLAQFPETTSVRTQTRGSGPAQASVVIRASGDCDFTIDLRLAFSHQLGLALHSRASDHSVFPPQCQAIFVAAPHGITSMDFSFRILFFWNFWDSLFLLQDGGAKPLDTTRIVELETHSAPPDPAKWLGCVRNLSQSSLSSFQLLSCYGLKFCSCRCLVSSIKFNNGCLKEMHSHWAPWTPNRSH